MRYLTLIVGSQRQVMEFDTRYETDSQALHEALCMIDPGNEYSVKFSNRKPSNTKNTVPLFQPSLYSTSRQ